jgi:sensor domain CHASE-containing protein
MSPQDPWETHNEQTNGWQEYKRLVINELERANHRLDLVDKRLANMEKHITVLQTKAATWAAAVAFLISGGVTFLLQIL